MVIDFLVDIRSDHDAPAPGVRRPLLERCLARGETFQLQGNSFEACLLRDFGMTIDDAPIAALSLAGEGEAPGEHYWLRADPITLHPTLHRIAGRALTEAELDWPEARALADILAPHLRADDCELVVKHPLRWYLRCPTQRLRTMPPPREQVVIDEARMPGGADGPRWQRLMTEAQMLLHATPIEADRTARGEVPVNGLWVWGGGRVRATPTSPYTDTFSDDVLALGLTTLSGARAHGLPIDPNELLETLPMHPNAHVLVAVSADRAVGFAALEAAWLRPLLRLIDARRAAQVNLRLFAGELSFGRRITRTAMRRWWRRSRLMHAYA